MKPGAEKIPGIHVDVEDLVRIQGHLSGLSLSRIRQQASFRSGARDTRQRGRGMEYEESRAYVAGDDVRTMDWRVMARSGDAHTKVFAEEKQRSFLLALDLSASMYFGTKYSFKSWTAAYVAAHVGWLASLSGDRVGGLIVSPDAHQEIRPGKMQSGLMGIFHHLAEISDRKLCASNAECRLNFLLSEVRRVARPGSSIALVSDFLGVDEKTFELLSGITRHNDVTAFWIHDQSEVDNWPAGHYQIWLGGEKFGIDVSKTKSKSWLSECQLGHREKVHSLTSAFNIPLVPLSCNQDLNAQFLKSTGLL